MPQNDHMHCQKTQAVLTHGHMVTVLHTGQNGIQIAGLFDIFSPSH